MKRILLLVLALGMCSINANAQTKKPVGKATTKAVPKNSREYKIDKTDGFEWYKVCKNGKYGAEDKNGNMLIPYEYTDIWYICLDPKFNNPVIFMAFMGDYLGAYSPDGRCIIPVSRKYTNIWPEHDRKYGQYYTYTKKDGMYGFCDVNGRQLFEAPYDQLMPEYSEGKFFYRVMKKVNGEKMYGIIDGNGNIVIPLQKNHVFESSGEIHKYINNDIKEENKVIIGSTKSISTTQHVLAANKSRSHPSSSNNSSNTKNSGGGTTKVIVEQHGPVQVWLPCGGCNGSGQCSTCFGSGTSMSGKSLCISCHGSGRCHFCAGKGGHYDVQYR